MWWRRGSEDFAEKRAEVGGVGIDPCIDGRAEDETLDGVWWASTYRQKMAKESTLFTALRYSLLRSGDHSDLLGLRRSLYRKQ